MKVKIISDSIEKHATDNLHSEVTAVLVPGIHINQLTNKIEKGHQNSGFHGNR